MSKTFTKITYLLLHISKKHKDEWMGKLFTNNIMVTEIETVQEIVSNTYTPL